MWWCHGTHLLEQFFFSLMTTAKYGIREAGYEGGVKTAIFYCETRFNLL